MAKKNKQEAAQGGLEKLDAFAGIKEVTAVVVAAPFKATLRHINRAGHVLSEVEQTVQKSLDYTKDGVTLESHTIELVGMPQQVINGEQVVLAVTHTNPDGTTHEQLFNVLSPEKKAFTLPA